jgi:hypothetical protein
VCLFDVGNVSLEGVSLLLTYVNERLNLDIRAVRNGIQLRATEIVRGEALPCGAAVLTMGVSLKPYFDGLKFGNCVS